MKLYIGRNAFNTRDQTFEFRGEADTADGIAKLKMDYIEETNFKSYYERWIADKDFDGNPLWVIDFGSYNRFFYIYDLTGELLDRWRVLAKEYIDEQAE